MLDHLSPTALAEVVTLHAAVSGTKHHKAKRSKFVDGVAALSTGAHTLLTFCCWFCLFNTKFKAIDPSKYYMIPATEEPAVGFNEFLEVVRYYNRRPVIPSREHVLVGFLNKCSRASQEFYLLILSKKFITGLPLLEIQTSLQLGTIRSSDIYGPFDKIPTGFSDLCYPVSIIGMRSKGAELYAVAREPSSTYSLVRMGGEFTPVKPQLLPDDVAYIKTPRFTLVGFAAQESGRTMFHPIDYFETLKEFRGHLRGRSAQPYVERVEKLRRFQSENLLTQVTTDYIGIAHRSETVLPEVTKVMAAGEFTQIVFSDAETVISGRAVAVDVRVALGIIDSFWLTPGGAEGVNGFKVWFNGGLFEVTFDFAGKNNSLLNNILLVQGKMLEFLYLKVGSTRVGVGRKVCWGLLPWRPKKLRFTNIRIEKCALCGGTSNKHANRGLCYVCETNLYRWHPQYGVGRWIVPSPVMAEKRSKSAWEPALLTAVKYHFQGHLLEAREDGCWRFAPLATEEKLNDC